MRNEYTRQRQGRDFSILSHLADAVVSAGGSLNAKGIIDNNDTKDDTEEKKSLLARLEQCKEDAERSAIPIDGFDPPERGRSLV